MALTSRRLDNDKDKPSGESVTPPPTEDPPASPAVRPDKDGVDVGGDGDKPASPAPSDSVNPPTEIIPVPPERHPRKADPPKPKPKTKPKAKEKKDDGDGSDWRFPNKW